MTRAWTGRKQGNFWDDYELRRNSREDVIHTSSNSQVSTEQMLLRRLYCCFQAGFSLGILAQFTPGKPNGIYFDKEPRGSKGNHHKTELILRHGASEHVPVLSKGHFDLRWGSQPCLWGQRTPVLFCPTFPLEFSRDHYKQNLVKNSILILLGV